MKKITLEILSFTLCFNSIFAQAEPKELPWDPQAITVNPKDKPFSKKQ